PETFILENSRHRDSRGFGAIRKIIRAKNGSWPLRFLFSNKAQASVWRFVTARRTGGLVGRIFFFALELGFEEQGKVALHTPLKLPFKLAHACNVFSSEAVVAREHYIAPQIGAVMNLIFELGQTS